MSCIFLDQVGHDLQFNSKLENCIVGIFQQSENKEEVDEYCRQFKDKFKSAIEKGKLEVAILCVEVAQNIYKHFGTVQLTQFFHVVSYYISKLTDEKEQREVIDKVIEFADANLDDNNSNTHIVILNGVFNAMEMTNKNRIVLLRKLIKVCKSNSKEYLFAPYLLNINDLLNLSVYDLGEQLDIYEDFLDVIENTIKKDDLYLLAIEYMKQQNQAPSTEFVNREDKLLKYILKVVSDDKRLFDIESMLSQKCSLEVVQKNADQKKSFETITSGDISSISDSFKNVEKIFEKHDIKKDDYSDKVKLSKQIEIADKNNYQTYKELCEIMKVDDDEIEFQIIKAIECDFIEAVLDQPNEVVYFNKVLKRNVGDTCMKSIKDDLQNLLETLNEFKIHSD